MRANSPTAFMLLFAGMMLILAAVPNLRTEIAPYLAAGNARQPLSSAIVDGSYRPAASQRARDLYMWDCYAAINSHLGSSSDWSALHRACRREAYRAVASVPTDSLSWMVIALASYALREDDQMNDGLHHAWAAAPRLDHLADRRSYLAERNFDNLDERSRQIYEADIALLASSNDALPFLAARYVRNPERRDVYSKAVEQAPPRLQRRFLQLVKRLTVAPS